MKKVHIGYNIPTQEDVFIERYYADGSEDVVKTVIRCPGANWSYAMDFLSEDEFEILINREESQSLKEEIYIQNLGSEVTSYFTFY
ncbi:hypothetical protein [Vibrio coralliilyticus]|uniref:hypothetical protein n=1 Tax=Vibrio coralliilyticus TaxID=190893 RepID=UPI001E3C6488|nr:hypothetical protein [Vibrio coralliilyticus]MCC2521094.1 hypothetical protein [Vibrio coralliilyticus]